MLWNCLYTFYHTQGRLFFCCNVGRLFINLFVIADRGVGFAHKWRIKFWILLIIVLLTILPYVYMIFSSSGYISQMSKNYWRYQVNIYGNTIVIMQTKFVMSTKIMQCYSNTCYLIDDLNKICLKFMNCASLFVSSKTNSIVGLALLFSLNKSYEINSVESLIMFVQFNILKTENKRCNITFQPSAGWLTLLNLN